VFVDIGVKFFEHFLYIAEAVSCDDGCETGLWDNEDEFFYDKLHLPDGSSIPMRLRSIVGLIPLFAVHVLEERLYGGLPGLRERLVWFLEHRPDLAKLVSRWNEPGTGKCAAALAIAWASHESVVAPRARRKRISFRARRAGAVPCASRRTVCLRSQWREQSAP
jgi:hypothetical protein